MRSVGTQILEMMQSDHLPTISIYSFTHAKLNIPDHAITKYEFRFLLLSPTGRSSTINFLGEVNLTATSNPGITLTKA